MLVKALLVACLLVIGEIINGNIRVRLLHHLLGKRRAKTVSFFTGVVLIYTICWLALPWLSPQSYAQCLVIGFLWLVVMVLLDLYVGRRVFHLRWQKIAQDFNPARGNLLSLGLLLLFLSPAIVYALQR